MLQYYDAGSLDQSGIPNLVFPHTSAVSLVSETTSRCFFPPDSRIKIKPELYFIRHRVVQSFIEGRRTRLHWIPCFIFTTQEVSLVAPILGDFHIVLVEFDPDEMTPQFQSHFSASGHLADFTIRKVSFVPSAFVSVHRKLYQ